MDHGGITPIEKFYGITKDVYLKNHHTCVFPVYVLDALFKGNIYGVPKWEPRSLSGIYLGHSPFHAGSVPLVINPATGHFYPQFNGFFDDEFPQLHS